MQETIAALDARGIAVDVASVGSTPTMHFLHEQPSATEARPGNYVYRDATQVLLGTATVEDCALRVLVGIQRRLVVEPGSLVEPVPGYLLIEPLQLLTEAGDVLVGHGTDALELLGLRTS